MTVITTEGTQHLFQLLLRHLLCRKSKLDIQTGSEWNIFVSLDEEKGCYYDGI